MERKKERKKEGKKGAGQGCVAGRRKMDTQPPGSRMQSYTLEYLA